MAMNFFSSVKEAISNLNPQEIRDQAGRQIQVGVLSQSEAGYREIEEFLLPSWLSEARANELRANFHRVSYEAGTNQPRYDIEIVSPDTTAPPGAFVFNPAHPDQIVDAILEKHPGWSIALARVLPPFRIPVANYVVQRISKENALFALATALPDLIPMLSLPWAIGEVASDTAVLTANQIRLAFLLAGISDRPIGYREQKGEVASILLGALGWRALARELVGFIPFGGGLLPKAAIAYAGTMVAGMSLERYYRIGSQYTADERRLAYSDAIERGKAIAGAILDTFTHKQVGASSAN